MSKKLKQKNCISILKTKNNKIDISIPLPNWKWWQAILFVLTFKLAFQLNINADKFIKILELIVKIKG